MANKRGNSEGGGGSRASKKRAKQKQKQKQIQQLRVNHAAEEKVEHDDNEHQHEHPTSVSKSISANKKLQLPLDDDDSAHEEDILVVKKKKKKKKLEKSDTEMIETLNSNSQHTSVDKREKDVNEIGNKEREDEILQEICSNLTTAEILFPEEYEVGVDSEEGDLQPNPYEIIQNVTTEQRAKLLFDALLKPSGLSSKSFYEHYWEKKPLLVSQNKNLAEPDESGMIYGEDQYLEKEELKEYQKRFNGFLSKNDIEKMISDYPMKYGKDLNVTNYCKTGGVKRRVTLDQLPNTSNTTGDDYEFIEAESNDVWENFNSGCTLRLLCPHKLNDRVHCLLSNLEHEFGCFVGSNAYLTPGGSPNQGFAPHYDDIEAFILQLEGYKKWRVYKPMSKAETLPRESSRDFTEDQMKDIEPVVDVVLGPGDLLYMPRGWVHQANTCKSKHHSLHLTVSAMQNWSWADLLDIMIPEALETASAKSVSLRAGLPRKFLSYMGTMHDQTESEILNQGSDSKNDSSENHETSEEEKDRMRMSALQDAFKSEAKKKIMRVCKEAVSMITDGCDQIAKRFLSDRLPPSFTLQEAALTSENREENGGKIFPNTLVRLAKPSLARLVVEDDKAVVYHSLDNSRVFHENPLSPLEFEIDDAPALEMLLTTVEPHWICVQDLIHGDIEEKMDIAQSLYDEGILAVFQQNAPDKTVQTN